MNKKGQIGDILEFKVGLVILLVMFVLAIILFNLSHVVSLLNIDDYSSGGVLKEEDMVNLQRESFYQDLLIDYLKKGDKGDLVLLDPSKIESEFKDKEQFSLLIEYPDGCIGIRSEYVSLIEDFQDTSQKVSHTIMPTFDGEIIVDVYLMGVRNE